MARLEYDAESRNGVTYTYYADAVNRPLIIRYQYTYNGWGEILSVNNKIGTFGTLNPIRYRGYYYDTELNMYYLQSRYYDPVVKRMLCADDPSTILSTGDALKDTNLFAYCFNSPVEYKDDEGDIPVILIEMAWGGGIELVTQLLETRDIKKVKWGEVAGAAICSGLSMGFSQSLQSTRVGMKIGSLACDAVGELSANLFVNAAQGQSAGENIHNSTGSALASAMIGTTSSAYSYSRFVSKRATKSAHAKYSGFSKTKQHKLFGSSKKNIKKHKISKKGASNIRFKRNQHKMWFRRRSGKRLSRFLQFASSLFFNSIHN